MDEPAVLGDGSEVSLLDAVDQMIREVIASLMKTEAAPIKKAMLSLMTHMSAHWRAFYLLHVHAEQRERGLLTHSCAILTRCMFDAYLQFAYMSMDSSDTRATLYLDYAPIEKYRRERKTVKRDDDLSKIVACSPRRPEGEKQLKDAYDSVLPKYLVKSKKGKPTKPRVHWYEGHLSDIASEVGKSDEYHWFVDRFHSSVHAGPLAAREGFPADDFLLYAAILMARVARIVVDRHGIRPTPAVQSVIDAFAEQSITA